MSLEDEPICLPDKTSYVVLPFVFQFKQLKKKVEFEFC